MAIVSYISHVSCKKPKFDDHFYVSMAVEKIKTQNKVLQFKLLVQKSDKLNKIPNIE